MHKFVMGFICFVFILIVSIWALVGVTIYKGVSAVSDNGLRSVIESVWCGKDATCMTPKALMPIEK